MTKEEYNENPNICKQCGKPILCKDGDKVSYISKMKYCSKNCFYKSFNTMYYSGIYAIKNISTGHLYFGQAKNISRRKSQHLSSLRNNKHGNQHLQNAWNKYGESDFEFYVVEKCDEDLLDEKEMYYINKYNTTDRNFGYNIESGGNANKILGKEQRRKISEHHADVSGARNPFYKKKHSEKTIQRITNNENYINRKHIGEDSHFAKLTEDQAREIKLYCATHEVRTSDAKRLAEYYNVGINAILKIKQNRTWKHISV